jgi:hypothetical protein
MKFAVRKPYSKYRISADVDHSAVQNPQKNAERALFM